MRLVIIYGAEATGKLTVAKHLASKTAFRLFHNHVSVDVARVLFNFGEPGFSELVWDIRELVIARAATAGVDGLIFTWAYSHPDFLPYVARLRALIAANDVTASYVYLTCSTDERKRRVSSTERAQAGKISTPEALERQMSRKQYDLIPDSDSLTIDVTSLPPADAAAEIIAHFSLPESP